jgi:hypothetical protein
MGGPPEQRTDEPDQSRTIGSEGRARRRRRSLFHVKQETTSGLLIQPSGSCQDDMFHVKLAEHTAGAP